jgi:electron transfer flavoprotein alpha subunit
VQAERETDSGFESIECNLPALVSATEDLAAERFPKRAEKEAAKAKAIGEVAARDLSEDVRIFGVAGSPTRVEGLETMTVDRAGRMFDGEPDIAMRALVAALVERGAIMAGSTTTTAEPRPTGARDRSVRRPVDPKQSIWVLAEVLEGKLRRVTFELLGKARELSAASAGPVVAILLGHGVRAHAGELAQHGADAVLVCDDPLLDDYSTDAYAWILAGAIRERQPRAVLVPSTLRGRDLAPRVAARLGLGLTGDAIDLSFGAEGRLVQWKPAFGGNIVAPILSSTLPEMATVRPGMLEPLARDRARVAPIEEIRIREAPAIRTLVTGRHIDPGFERAAALDESKTAIGIGMGLGGADKLGQLEPLVAALGGAAVAVTRDVADAGWLPRQHQVGLTGRAISPRLYVAVGIRGAFEHMVGVRRAGTIVAINKSPKAPIFAQSDFGLLADWTMAVPLLAREIEAVKTPRG